MIQKVFKYLEQLQVHIEQLPLEQKAILSSNLNYLSAALQELAIEFQPLWNPQAARASGDQINSFFYPKIAHQAAIIRQLEKDLEQSQSQYKKVTQALTQGEARLQTILRNSSDLITIIEADGRIRDQSPVALERILGYKPEQRIGKLQSDLLHPEDLPVWQAYFAKLLRQPGIAPPLEYRKRHASGNWVYLEVIANNLLHDSSINGIMINSRDITERKLSESKLEKSQKQIVNILENITDGFCAIDRHWQFTYVNPKAEEWWHRKRQELLGKNIWEQFPDTAKTIFFDELHKAVSRNVVVKFEAYYEQLNIWFEVEAYPSEEGLSVFFQDITDRKKAEADRKNFITQLFQVNCNLELALDTELKITKATSRFVPNQFLSFLGCDSIVNVKLGDAIELEMSILFSDIRDFTTLSEQMTPQENFKFINSYLSRMEPLIVENHGFIDKYIGDAIMALFSDFADDAVKAGIAMLNILTDYNEHRQSIGYIPIQIGIGINSGSLMLGTVGGQSRMDSTVISDAVNLASRIEGLTKDYGVPLLISQETLERLRNPADYAIRIVDKVQVKGKSQYVIVYEVFDADPPEILEAKLANLPVYTEAMLLCDRKEFREAGKLFEECLRINPSDRVARIYLKRCRDWRSLLKGI